MTLQPIRILINVLDDQEWLLELIKDIFHDDQTWIVQTYNKPDSFIAAFNDNVDLVISDIRVEGYDVVETLRQFAKINPSCYLVVMSAYLDDMYDTLINEVGVDKTVKKTEDYNWIEVLKKRVEELKPKILDKPKFKIKNDF